MCDLIEGLGDEQFEHYVIYFHSGPKVELLQKMNVKLYCVSGIVLLYDPVFFYRLFCLIKKIKPDCIHSLLWAANFSSRLVAYFFSIIHISVYHNNIDQDGFFRNSLDYVTRKLSNKIIAVSEEVSGSILNNDKRFKKEDIFVIHNGVNSELIRLKAKKEKILRKDIGLSEKDFVIGSVGRFCKVKNYKLLIESFADISEKVDSARLLLVGIGPDEKFLREQVKDFDIEDKVKFIIGKSAYGYFPLFDCFVQSSNKEGISIALLEAFSCGVPVVSTNLDKTHPVLVSGENGIIVPAGNKKMLSKGICMIIENNKLRIRYAKAGMMTVENKFSIESMISGYRVHFRKF